MYNMTDDQHALLKLLHTSRSSLRLGIFSDKVFCTELRSSPLAVSAVLASSSKSLAATCAAASVAAFQEEKSISAQLNFRKPQAELAHLTAEHFAHPLFIIQGLLTYKCSGEFSRPPSSTTASHREAQLRKVSGVRKAFLWNNVSLFET